MLAGDSETSKGLGPQFDAQKGQSVLVSSMVEVKGKAVTW